MEKSETHSNQQNGNITRHKRGKNTQIPPPIPPIHLHPLQELLSILERAELAVTPRLVDEIPRAARLEEISHILAARLPDGCDEAVQLPRRAFDFPACQFRGGHAADEAGEGVEFVEPGAPEGGHGGGRDGDAAEEGEGDDDEGVEEDGDVGGGGESCDHLA